jgi:hypothetical protein
MLRGIEVRRRKARTLGFVAPTFAGVPCRKVLQLVGPSLRAGTALVKNGHCVIERAFNEVVLLRALAW